MVQSWYALTTIKVNYFVFISNKRKTIFFSKYFAINICFAGILIAINFVVQYYLEPSRHNRYILVVIVKLTFAESL